VTGLRERLAGLFVEPMAAEQLTEVAGSVADPPVRWLPPVAPAAAVSAAPVAESRAALACGMERVAVIAARGDAALGAAAVALGLLQRRRAPCAVIARWTADEPGPPRAAAAVGAARRLAAALGADGHAAHASGRLVWIDLPADEPAAVAAADRALRGATPGLLVVAGPRGKAMERALAACGVLVVAARATADPEILAAAVAELGGLGPPVVAVDVGVPGAAAALCRAGVVLPAGLRDAVDVALAAGGRPG
jgi:hypothetical protein